ncbi:MAG: helix-turn-helix domain-containing protein [Clostridia bacterium]|nr:helix-turn-helix domain-containing protein [Clostridia bacterium]
MSTYTGYLIRRERLAKNLSQEGVCKGICAASYLSKIESGSVEPGEEIIDRLFDALGIDFVRDPALESEAQRQLDRFLFLMDADEPYDAQRAFFEAHRERLLRSEFAIKLQLYELISSASIHRIEEMRRMLGKIEPFMACLNTQEQQWMLLIKAELAQDAWEEGAVLAQAAALRASGTILYKQAKLAFQQGWYSRCVELGERAYAQSADEGNVITMIWSAYLMGTCACNRYDMALARRYYDRVQALCRGHREDMDSYLYYNLGSTYLELGRDEEALRYLEESNELENDALHNVLLHQKLTILYAKTEEIEKAREHLDAAKAYYARSGWKETWPAAALVGQMLRFAAMTLEEEPANHPEYERIVRALYDGVTEHFGFGFKRFYGRYLVELLTRQRRYKEALAVREEMEFPILS